MCNGQKWLVFEYLVNSYYRANIVTMNRSIRIKLGAETSPWWRRCQSYRWKSVPSIDWYTFWVALIPSLRTKDYFCLNAPPLHLLTTTFSKPFSMSLERSCKLLMWTFYLQIMSALLKKSNYNLYLLYASVKMQLHIMLYSWQTM